MRKRSERRVGQPRLVGRLDDAPGDLRQLRVLAAIAGDVGLEPLAGGLITLDDRRRDLQTRLQERQTRRNEASKAIGQAKGRGEDAEALLAEDLHVCVLRPPKKGKFNGPQQISLLMQNYEAVQNYIDRAVSPVLMVATLSGVRIRTIDELIAEFGG